MRSPQTLSSPGWISPIPLPILTEACSSPNHLHSSPLDLLYFLFFLNACSFIDGFSKYITVLFLLKLWILVILLRQVDSLTLYWISSRSSRTGYEGFPCLQESNICADVCAQTFLSAVKKTNPTSPWVDFLRYLYTWGLTWMKHQDSLIQEVLEGCIKLTINTSQLPLSLMNSTFIPRR